MDMLQVCVARKQLVAEDICSFALESEGKHPLPAFAAGSHIDVLTPSGQTRQYSLCNTPAESHRYLIAVLKEKDGRGGSVSMHEGVEVGDRLTISTPKNHFALVKDARQSLLLAGGIGITPILCMAHKLGQLGADFELHYSTRSRARTAFHKELVDSAFADRIRLHTANDAASGRINLKQVLASPTVGKHLYVCGPKGYMDAVLAEARAAGWSECHLHYEFFAGVSGLEASDGSFEVQLARDGRIVMVPADKTVVDALRDAGIEVPTSCEQGVCGTCLTRVLHGEPDHRDMFLTVEEQVACDQFLPCCSRSKSSRLVLDL